MQRMTVLLLGAVLLAAGCAARPGPMPPAPPRVMIGDRAPDFAFVTTSGRRVDAASLRGKPFVLFFFASWCEYCVKQAPDVEKLHQQCRARHLPLYAIGINGYADVLSAKAKRLGLTAPVALSQDMALSYGASTVPFTVFVNEHGIVVWTVTGAGPYEQLEKGLTAVQGGPIAAGAARGGQ